MLEILIADGDRTAGCQVAAALRRDGHRVTIATTSQGAEGRLATLDFDLLIADVALAPFSLVERTGAQTAVLVTSERNDVREAVAAIRASAVDYVTKPIDLARLTERVADFQEQLHGQVRRVGSTSSLGEQEDDEELIVGRSATMRKVLQRVRLFSARAAPVLITGESGTGKELIARALHRMSPRRAQPLIAVNCAAFPETLLEAELFGHVRGAFTGAIRHRAGRFKAAHQGSLFLDEIGELSFGAQAKLLRVLQEGTYAPIGTNTTERTNARLIFATNQDLKQRVAAGAFRKDLYYRVNVFNVALPPLRERMEDVPLLVRHFIAQLDPGGAHPGISREALAALGQHAFPGNVRELQHAVEYAHVIAGASVIEREHLPPDILDGQPGSARRDEELPPLAAATRAFERRYMERALAAAGGNRTRAAKLLGISRKSLWEKLRRHGE